MIVIESVTLTAAPPGATAQIGNSVQAFASDDKEHGIVLLRITEKGFLYKRGKDLIFLPADALFAAFSALPAQTPGD
jgi:hypothetical protein